MTGQFTTEYLYTTEPSINGITINGTHAIFPMGKLIQFNYIRRLHAQGDEEVGIANQRFSENSAEIVGKPMIADDINIAVSEKMHAFRRKHPLDTTAYYRAMDHLENADREGHKSNDFFQRNLITTALASVAQPIMKLWRGVGGSNFWIRKFADKGDVPPHFRDRATALRNAMERNFTQLTAANTNFSDPILSSVNCFHWNATVDLENQIVIFPLNKKLSTYRGHTVSAPFMSMSVLQGTSYWSYREDVNQLEIYFGSALEVVLRDPYVANPEADVYVAPPDGQGEAAAMPKWEHQRADVLSLTAYGLKQWRDRKYANDWHFLFNDQDVQCPPDHLAKIDGWLDEITAAKGSMGPLMEYWNVAKAYVNVLQCTTTFARPDHTNAAEYGVYMSNALFHGLLETPRRFVVSGLAARDWNTIDLSQVPRARVMS